MNYDAQSLNSHLVPKPVGKDKLELKGNNVFKALFAVSVMGTTLKDSPAGKNMQIQIMVHTLISILSLMHIDVIDLWSLDKA